MDGQGLRMCRFTRDGIPELGEYLESVDGTGICKLTELDGGGEEVVVCLPDGTMPEGISDLELVRVPTRIEEGDAKTETMSDETAERMARTRFIVDEYTMGVLDEQGYGARIMLGDHEETGALQARRYQLRAHGVAQPRVAGQRRQQSRRGMVLFRVSADAVLSGAQRVEKIEYGQCGLPVSHVQPPEE